MGWFRRNEHDEEQLSAYLDGELNARQAENVERHLVVCETCSALLEELRETRALLSALPTQTPARSFVLGAEYARAPVQDEARPSKRFNLALAPAVALSVFVGLLVVDLGNFTSSSSNDDGTALTAATSREAQDGAAAGSAGALEAPGELESANSAAAGADVDNEAASDAIEPATAPGALEGTGPSEGTQSDATSEGPPAPMSADELPESDDEGDTALRATGQAAEEEFLAEPQGFDSPQSDGDDGISTLRVLQVLAGAAFLASGFYVFVWPRLSRGGS